MLKPAYNITLGTSGLDSTQDPPTGGLVSLLVESSLSIPADRFIAVIANVSDVNANVGDNAQIELGYEDELTTVMTGFITDIKRNLETLTITSCSPMQKLLNFRNDRGVQLNTKAGEVVSALAQDVGVNTAEVENGVELPAYTVDGGWSYYQHCLRLAKISGFDIYANTDGQLVFQQFNKSSADHNFGYSRNIIKAKSSTLPSFYDKIDVIGESPSGSQGSDTWHWFIKDSQPLKGSAGDGNISLLIQEPLLRSRTADETFAQSKYKRLQQATRVGQIKVLGNAEVKLGDAIAIEDAEPDELNGTFKITSVRHSLDKKTGFITTIGFCKIES